MSRLAVISSTVCLAVGAMVGASMAHAHQPHMENALGLMESARTELLHASANKGDHRERAIEAVDRAIYETREGIAYAGG